ncbi:MAG: glycogen/starch/alpha-glucan phosphorylase [Bacilli bacterium]|nr:glycogen/starch/alpha-glucan phosphorylase [Bacilli bacterium]
MFSSKESFKREFTLRLARKYGRDVEKSHITERYDILGEMVRDYAGNEYRVTHDEVVKKKQRQLIYFSMEFLMGRLLVNNMQNLGVYEIAKKGLDELGINIHELEEMESDAGLGNGGLGRLAACFLDSIASLGYSGHGNCLRFEFGFFRQKLNKGYQKELPDQWLTNGYVFEVRKPKHAVTVNFYGYSELYTKPNGKFGIRTSGAIPILAMPYDVSIVGYRNGVTNTLRMWQAVPSSELLPDGTDFNHYLYEVNEICHNLYPDDSYEEGKMLRLKQEYFLVSAGLQSVIRGHLRQYKNLDNLSDAFVFHLNDTHPVLAIPELMRLLMDEHDYGWDDAWKITKKCIAYTNHTVLPEALERWPIHFMQRLIPRCYNIIEEIHRRFMVELNDQGIDNQTKYNVSIIKDGQVHMANLGVYASFSVNGVAKIHTDILKKTTFADFYRLYPKKFNNKTNGVTHRRWLLNANPELAKLITSKIGEDWITNPIKLEDFRKFEGDNKVLTQLMKIKHNNKVNFAKYVKEQYGIEIDPNSIFDVQIKRLHAYKRQLMNILHVIYLYYYIKENPLKAKEIYPKTFIFGAKAAPSYYYAKKVIELILGVANVVNNDSDVNKYIKVVFVENYGVTLAERIIPAADISEQISTAGYEASGTSNMKLMMNGAITLGTLDGANIEIADYAKKGNNIIFGLKANEVAKIKNSGEYNPWDIYNTDQSIHRIIDSLFNGPWCKDPNQFRPIFDEIMNKRDEYLIFKDFHPYLKSYQVIDELYRKPKTWAKMSLNNIAGSGVFSSDRTIEQYNKDIWGLKKLGNLNDR